MSQRNPVFEAAETPWSSHGSGTKWDLMECDKVPSGFKNPFSARVAGGRQSQGVFSPDWANAVPSLIEKLVSEVVEKKKMELRFSLLENTVRELKSQINALAAAKTRIIPINTFAPEPYELLKPMLVCVQACEDGFEAGWYQCSSIH